MRIISPGGGSSKAKRHLVEARVRVRGDALEPGRVDEREIVARVGRVRPFHRNCVARGPYSRQVRSTRMRMQSGACACKAGGEHAKMHTSDKATHSIHAACRLCRKTALCAHACMCQSCKASESLRHREKKRRRQQRARVHARTHACTHAARHLVAATRARVRVRGAR